MKNLVASGAALVLAMSVPTCGAESIEAASSGGLRDEITLAEAVAAALGSSPVISVREIGVLAADARLEQAGLLPNPELELEVENFAGSGDLSGFEGAETTFLLSQEIELGGKRSRRRAVADAEKALAVREQERARRDVIAATSADFFSLLAAQERLLLAERMLSLSERLLATVEARVAAGKVSPVEASRARVPTTMAQIEVDTARHELAAVRSRLAANWGGVVAAFGRAVGELELVAPLPPLAQLLDVSEAGPDMLRWRDEERRMEVELEMERSLRVPNLKVGAGPRRFEQTGDSAWVGGIALELPIFDRRQGSTRAAEYEIERAQWWRRAAATTLHARIAGVRERLAAASTEVRLLAREAVPAATEAFEAVQTGYREGKFGLLETLDAQRLLFTTRARHLEALERYHLTRVELERLVGASLDQIIDPPAAATS